MKITFQFLALAAIFWMACGQEKAETTALHPKKVLQVGFLVMDGVYNTELTAPMDIFHHTVYHDSLGMKVFTIAKDSGLITTFEGMRFLADYSYQSDDYPPIDVLVVPSAEHHLDTDLEDEVMLDFVRQTAQNAQYVVSLCDGAFVLAEAGLLDGLASTTFPGDIETYKKRYPQLQVYSDLLFVHDGKFITSSGGAKSFEPAIYLVERLYGEAAAEGVGRGMVIDWDLNHVPHMVIQP